MRKLVPFAFNFLFFAYVAFVMPFTVLYFQSRGFDGTQIGFITGITPLIGLVSAPLLTGFADATSKHRLVLSIALLGAAAGFFFVPLVTTFVPLLVLLLFTYALVSPVSPLADSATMLMLGDEKEMYGRIRLGGTIGFAIAALIAGVLVQNYGLASAFWGGSVLLALTLVVSQKLTHAHVESGGLTRDRIGQLLGNRGWIPFWALAFAGGLALTGTNTYLLPHMQELGASPSLMGIALTAGTIGEIPVLFFSNRLIRRLRPYGLLLLAMFITGARLLALGAATTPDLILFLQLFNGLTYPMMWTAGVAYANENAPRGMSATSQGLFGMMVYGFGSAAGNFLGGPVLTSLGGRALFVLDGVVVLATVAIVWLAQKLMRVERPERVI